MIAPTIIDLAKRDWAAWNIEYHRVGSGGGWPTTLEDLGHALDHLREMAGEYHLDPEDIVAIGHSAGGHLALWSASRPKLHAEEPAKPDPVRPEADHGDRC